MNFFWKFLMPRSTKNFFWREQLESYKQNELMVSADEIDSIINIFLDDKIAPDKFTANLIHVITNGNDKFNAIFNPRIPEMLKNQTPSINSVCVSAEKRQGIPSWFYAAYPDVLAWLSQKERSFAGADNFIERSFKLFGIDKNNFEDGNTKNKNGCIKFEYLKNLIKNFKKEIKIKKMETSTKNI